MLANMSDPMTIMAGAGWLSGQPTSFRSRVVTLSRLRHYRAGQQICGIGDPPGDLFGLVDGELSVMISPEESAPILVHVATPGWWIGEAALMTDTPRRVTMTARRPSTLLALSPTAVRQLAGEDPETWRRLACITVGHLDHALSVIATLTATDPRIRVAVALRRAVRLTGGAPTAAIIHVSQDELGELARLTRNALRPVLVELEGLGLIRRGYRRIEIPDTAALARFARGLSDEPKRFG